MKGKTALVFNPEIKKYSFGKGHPFTSERFEIFLNFLKEKVSNFNDYFEEILPKAATEDDLKLFHSQEYIEAIKKASKGIILPDIFQYITSDNTDPSTGYLPTGIEEASRMAVGSSQTAAKLVFEERFKKAISLGGGLHHAKRNFGEGFCIYNDVVISAKKLLEWGLKRILILDTDAHAGNGTAEAFWQDGRVLFIDIHQDPKTLYPGTGFIEEVGSGKGEGFIVNIPLPPGSSDMSFQYCFDQLIFPLADEFKPQIIIRNGGSDPHFSDILTNLGLTLDGFKMIGKNVKILSEKFCQGKEIDLIASGYNMKVLPFAWLSLISGLSGLGINLPEKSTMPRNTKLKETKEIIRELKNILKKYWKCLR